MRERTRTRCGRLEVDVTDARGRPARGLGVAGWLSAIAPARARGQVTIALVSDAVMRRLNRRFAGFDRVTDVLSFAPEAGGRTEPRLRGARRPASPGHQGVRQPLGDIVIATGKAVRQARQAGHPLRIEVRVLALHGLLHLLGYDHHADRGTMARLEQRLRRRGGLAAGLIERRTAS